MAPHPGDPGRPQSGVLPRPRGARLEHLHADPDGPGLRLHLQRPTRGPAQDRGHPRPGRACRCGLALPRHAPCRLRPGGRPGRGRGEGGAPPARPAARPQRCPGLLGQPQLAARLPGRAPVAGGLCRAARGTGPAAADRDRRGPELRGLGAARGAGHERDVQQPLGGRLRGGALPQERRPAPPQGDAADPLRVSRRPGPLAAPGRPRGQPDRLPGRQPPSSASRCAAPTRP